MEMANSFGDIPIANYIRETVREDFDENHKLFDLTDTKKSKFIDVRSMLLSSHQIKFMLVKLCDVFIRIDYYYLNLINVL